MGNRGGGGGQGERVIGLCINTLSGGEGVVTLSFLIRRFHSSVDYTFLYDLIKKSNSIDISYRSSRSSRSRHCWLQQ